MRLGQATGLQVAFLSFAVILLTAPLSIYIGRKLELPPDWVKVVGRIGQLSMLAMAIFLIHLVRPDLLASLLTPLPRPRRLEVAGVAIADTFFAFALFGGIAAVHWVSGGPLAVERRFPTDIIHAADQAYAFSSMGLVTLFAGVAIAPIVEEIVFRGLLYRAWERAWGWIVSMVLTSTVFALYHHNFASAFLFSVLAVCLYRRTGTLLAPMLVHATHNLSVWYPLGGQFLIPRPELPAGDLSTWSFHFAILTIYVVVLPVYVIASRNSLIQDHHGHPLPH